MNYGESDRRQPRDIGKDFGFYSTCKKTDTIVDFIQGSDTIRFTTF